jgi:hypothetical protein
MKLRLSARGTAGCEFSLWDTPNTTECPPQEMLKGRAKPTIPREQADEETMRLWRTPKADDPNHGPANEAGIMRRLEKHQTIRLQDQVNHPRLFRTPDAGCSRGAQSKERFAESLKEGRQGTRSPEGAVKELARGHGMDLGSSVRKLNVAAGGSLNSDWVEWLMGFPIGWTADIGG